MSKQASIDGMVGAAPAMRQLMLGEGVPAVLDDLERKVKSPRRQVMVPVWAGKRWRYGVARVRP